MSDVAHLKHTTPRPAPVLEGLPKPSDRTGPTLLELASPSQCRNPVGPDPRVTGRDQMFCGRRTGMRSVEIRKGVFAEKPDTYCTECAARNRVGCPPSFAARNRLERAARAFR